MAKEKLKLIQQIFEVRYERGYRYFDRCGDVMLVLEDLLAGETGKTWMTQEVVAKGAQMKCPALDTTITIDSYRLGIDQAPADQDCPFAVISELAFATISGRFDLRDVTRLGHRRVHLLPMDSLEEAEKGSVRAFPLKDWPMPPDKGLTLRQTDMSVAHETEDGSFGYRFSVGPAMSIEGPVQIDDRLKLPPRLLAHDQRHALLDQLRRARQREDAPLAGLRVDMDFYAVRPAKPNVKEFIQRAHNIEPRLIEAWQRSCLT